MNVRAGNRSKVSPSRNSGKHQEGYILNTKKAPAFRESFQNFYARFTGLVFLSWELSDELGKLPKGMAYPGRLRTHPTKRSVKRVSFGTISLRRSRTVVFKKLCNKKKKKAFYERIPS